MQFSLRRFYLPLLMALCVMYAFRPIGAGYDFWAHAAVGRWIVEHGRPPATGLYLWGSEPTPWIAHSWLCQAFFYLLLQAGGGWTPQGNASVGNGPLVVVLFTTLIACAVFAVLWRLWKRCSNIPIAFWTPVIFAIAIWSAAPRFQPRQELLSALFIAVLLSFLVERQHDKTSSTRSGRRTQLIVTFVAIVVLFALWVNLHALVALGLVFLWTTAICDALQDRFDKRSRWLLALAVCCTVATLLNPYGLHYWAAADQLKPGNMANYIEEWKPPSRTRNLWPYIGSEMTLSVLALLAWCWNPKRRWAHALWVILMSYLFLKQTRHLWILAIVALAVLASNADFFDSERAWRWWRRVTKQDVGASTRIGDSVIPVSMRRIAQGGSVLILAVWAISARPSMTNTGVSSRVPERLAFALEQGQQRGELPRGHLFNDYAWSSYLQWRLNGARETGRPISIQGANPIYIDLLNAYPDGPRGLLQEYFKMLKGSPESMALMKRRGVNLVLLPPHFRDDKKVGLFRALLRNSQQWRVVQSDTKQGTLWVRRQPVPLPQRSVIFDGVPVEKEVP